MRPLGYDPEQPLLLAKQSQDLRGFAVFDFRYADTSVADEGHGKQLYGQGGRFPAGQTAEANFPSSCSALCFKSETRNQKPEIRRNAQNQKPKLGRILPTSGFGFWAFFRISGFWFRVCKFPAPFPNPLP